MHLYYSLVYCKFYILTILFQPFISSFIWDFLKSQNIWGTRSLQNVGGCYSNNTIYLQKIRRNKPASTRQAAGKKEQVSQQEAADNTRADTNGNMGSQPEKQYQWRRRRRRSEARRTWMSRKQKAPAHHKPGCLLKILRNQLQVKQSSQ